ncbi:hypothetical protein ACFS6H_12145 [Terrimonas rubra]|uniref:Uncharacterized protein n=1 Tax=Terrimonas rubra TaxID=1035890 RepID=A0ABW6A9U3_9BACT
MTATNKKTLRKQVEDKLTTAFADIKEIVGEKKFSKKIKKAGKILAEGVTAKATPKKKAATGKKTSPAKKTKAVAPKKTAAKPATEE